MYKTRGILVGLLVAVLAIAAGCTTTSGSGDPAQRRAAIETGVDDALATLFREVPGSRELVSQANGVLVFPDVLEAGFMIAAARGSGALRVGGVTRSYHAHTAGSFGLQAGAQSTAVFLLFMTDEALSRFENSSGWTVGADASVTLLTAGASAQVTTATAQQPVIGFVLANRGLMAGISLDGARITRLNL
jgi:lipid-binding SYLF domain-containing protein